MNSKGPRMLPCGTPEVTSHVSEATPSMATVCDRFVSGLNTNVVEFVEEELYVDLVEDFGEVNNDLVCDLVSRHCPKQICYGSDELGHSTWRVFFS